MKINEEVASAAIGGAFFAIPWLVLGIPVIPSVIIGGAAFAAGELVLSKKTSDDAFDIPSGNFKKTIATARKQSSHIKNKVNDIEDNNIKDKLTSIHECVENILLTIEKNPNKVKNINNFFDYYLPITIKIIDRYDEIEDGKLNSKDSKRFIEDTNKMVVEIDQAFKKILNKLYEHDIIDTDAEMKVFTSMLKMDGYDSKEIDVEKEDNNG